MQLTWTGWGVSLRLKGPPERLQLSRDAWPPPAPDTTPKAPQTCHDLVWDSWRGLWRGESSGEYYLHLDQAVALETACYSPFGLFFHAGAVGWQGKAWLILGPSYSGKSELVHALVSLGCEYFSDEFAVVQENGLVLAYPRLLRRRVGQQTRALPGAACPPAPLPLGGLMGLRFSGKRSWRSGSLEEGFALLIRQCVAARRKSRELLGLCARQLPDLPVLIGERDEALDCGQDLVKWMEQEISRG